MTTRAEELAAKIEEMPAEILHAYPFLLDAASILRALEYMTK